MPHKRRERRDTQRAAEKDLKQSEVYADSGVYRLDKMVVVDLNIIHIVADRMTDHFGGGEWRQQIFERKAGVVSKPKVIGFRADDNGHPVMNLR